MSAVGCMKFPDKSEMTRQMQVTVAGACEIQQKRIKAAVTSLINEYAGKTIHRYEGAGPFAIKLAILMVGYDASERVQTEASMAILTALEKTAALVACPHDEP